MTQCPSPASPGIATRATITKPVVLVGMMGAGKSTVGRRLANRLGLPFVDSDDEIEEAAGMSVGELFESYGEAQFRDGERRLIVRLMDGKPKVVATGGGAFVDDQTRALMLATSTTVWLKANVDILAERVGRRDTRPLLRDADPAKILGELMAKRESSYNQAHIHIESGAGAHEQTVERILRALAQ